MNVFQFDEEEKLIEIRDSLNEKICFRNGNCTAVMLTRIRSDPHSFGSVDSDPSKP